MKKSTKTRMIIFGSMFVLGLIICGITLATINFDYTKLSTVPPASERIQVNEQLTIFDSTNISIDLSLSDIYIGVSNDDTVHITYYNSEQQTYEIEQNDDELILHQINQSKTWWTKLFSVNFDTSNRENNNVHLLIPAQFNGELNVETSSGNIRIESISTKEDILLATSFGRIELTEVKSTDGALIVRNSNGKIASNNVFAKEDILITTSFGSIEVTNAESSDGMLTVKSSNGNIATTNISAKENIATTTSFGSVELANVKSSDGMLSVKSSNGEIASNNVFAKEDISITASFGSIEVTNAESSDGDLIVRNSNGRISTDTISVDGIHLDTNYGDIQAEHITCTEITMENSSGDIKFSELDAQNTIIDVSFGTVLGSIVGSESDFSVTSHSGFGSNNLPESWGSGSKILDVSVSSGDIDISFTE